MHFKLLASVILTYSLCFLWVGGGFSSDTANELNTLSISQVQNVDTTENKKLTRDGIEVMPIPGSQIETARVDSVLEITGLSFGTYARTFDPDSIKMIIRKFNEVLQRESIQHDEELHFAFSTKKASLYIRLYSASDQKEKEYLTKARQQAQNAISILKNKSTYKADLADAYQILLSAYYSLEKYKKAISLSKFLIENYQDIGYGRYDNYFPVQQVNGLHNVAEKSKRDSTIPPDNHNKIIDYLKVVSEKYDNEVGVMAHIELMQHHFENGNKEKAVEFVQPIEHRLASLDNPEFEDHKWKYVKTRIVNYAKAEGDALFYEITTDMIKGAEIRLRNDSTYSIDIELKEAYHSEYAKQTASHIGSFLAVLYEGEIINPILPSIQASIRNGYIPVSGFTSKAKAKEVKQRVLSGQ